MIRMKWLRSIYAVYAGLVFLMIMLLLFPFTVLASFFGRIRGGNLIMILCRIWADTWFFLIGIRQRILYDVKHDRTKSYIFVSNHISYIDAAVIPKVFRQPIRPLGKVEMSKIPVFGFIYRNAIVTVDRSSASNRAKSVRILTSLIKKGISVLVFPEGTFNMTGKPLKEFFDGAFRVAIETQTPVKPVLFLDTYKRMPYTSVFHMSPGINRVVFMDEIPVEGLTVSDVNQLKQEVYSRMEKKLIQYREEDYKKTVKGLDN